MENVRENEVLNRWNNKWKINQEKNRLALIIADVDVQEIFNKMSIKDISINESTLDIDIYIVDDNQGEGKLNYQNDLGIWSLEFSNPHVHAIFGEDIVVPILSKFDWQQLNKELHQYKV